MSNNNNIYRNIYQLSRESTGLTQEKASELLDISVDSLRAYECEKRIPKDITIINMTNIYNDKSLIYKHMKINTSIGKSYLPNLKNDDFSTLILQFLKNINDFKYISDDIIKIASLGEINKSNICDWKGIESKLDEFISIIYTLKFMKKVQNDF